MHARVSTYQGRDTDRLIEGFESVTGALQGIEGFCNAYFMVDRETGRAMSITIWDSEDALNASVSQADELRKQGTQPSGAVVEHVQHFEIPIVLGTSVRA